MDQNQERPCKQDGWWPAGRNRKKWKTAPGRLPKRWCKSWASRSEGRRGLDKIQDMILQQDEEEDALDEEAAVRTGISAVYNYVSLVWGKWRIFSARKVLWLKSCVSLRITCLQSRCSLGEEISTIHLFSRRQHRRGKEKGRRMAIFSLPSHSSLSLGDKTGTRLSREQRNHSMEVHECGPLYRGPHGCITQIHPHYSLSSSTFVFAATFSKLLQPILPPERFLSTPYRPDEILSMMRQVCSSPSIPSHAKRHVSSCRQVVSSKQYSSFSHLYDANFLTTPCQSGCPAGDNARN